MGAARDAEKPPQRYAQEPYPSTVGAMMEFRLGPIPVRVQPIFFVLVLFLGLRHTNPPQWRSSSP